MADGDRPDTDMQERLARLSRDLDNRKASADPGKTPGNLQGPGNLGSAMSTGFRVMSEFVAAVAVGGVIGWQLDRWLGTSPFLLILFIALGTAAGFWTVYRIASKPTDWVGRR